MIRIENLSKRFGHGDSATTVLDGLSLEVASGEISAVVGPSGAGKSTLAQCVALLERPTSGTITVNGEQLAHLSERNLRVARRRIGTIFQTDSLFLRRTVAQNVALPLEYLGVTPADSARRVGELLERVHLGDLATRYPHELSGGQRQRVGIARALALRPTVLLSDEATSGLDPASTASVVALLRELRDDLNLAILFITHEMDTVLAVADSASLLDHGRIVESGAVVDLVRDPTSALGRALQPRRAFARAPGDDEVWFVTYDSPSVPGDWISRLTNALNARVSLLGGSVETLNTEQVGHVALAISPLDPSRVRAELESLGLHGTPAAQASPALAGVA
ncbi:MAG: methionine ABC transporter ATP-binding protein [Microbacteriaceae bacterium]